MDFIPFYCYIVDTLLQKSQIEKSINDYFKVYNISRDDYFDLFKKVELTPKNGNDSIKLDTKTKSAFTRMYKKMCIK